MKNLKKVLSLMLVLAMALSVTSVFAAVTPPVETGIPKVSGADVVINMGTKTKLEDGNQVMKSLQANYYGTNIEAQGSSQYSDIVISFDFMGQDMATDYLVFTRRLPSDWATGYDKKEDRQYIDIVNFAGIMLKSDGRIMRNTDSSNGQWDGAYTIEIGTYEANKWYSIDMVVKGINSTTYNTTVDYYLNGKYVGTYDGSGYGNSTDTNGRKYQSDASITTLYAGSPTASDTSKMYFDNGKIYNAKADEKYYAYVDAKSGEINVEFSETPQDSDAVSMKNAVIKANDGTTITPTAVTLQGRKLNVKYESASVNAGEEYTLVLPDIESVTGKKLANNAVVFTIPKNETPNVLYVAEHNFDSWTDTTTGWSSISGSSYDGTYSLIPSSLVEGKSGKAVQFECGNSNSEANSLTGFIAYGAYQPAAVSGLSEFIAEYDIKAPAVGQVTTVSYVIVPGGNGKVAAVLIDPNGYLTAATNATASNEAGIPSAGVVNANGEYTGTYSEATHKVYKTTAGQWYNVKISVNYDTGIVKYYVDNQLLAEYEIASRICNRAANKDAQLRLAACTTGNGVTNLTVIDNVKFGWTIGDVAQQSEVVNEFAATNTKTANGGWATENKSVALIGGTLDAAQNSQFASGAVVMSGDITIDDVKPNLMPMILSPKGFPIATFWIQNTDGDVFIDPNAQNVTGTAESDGKYYFTNHKYGTTVPAATVKGAFKSGVPTNVTAYMDSSRTYIYLFLNGVYAKTLTTAQLQGTTAGTNQFDLDGDNATDAFEITPAAVGIRMLEGASNTGKIKIENVKLQNAYKASELHDIRLNSADDEFSIYSANIPNRITSIDVNYTVAPASAPTSVTLKNSKDEDVTLGTITLTGATAKIPISSTVLVNGTYTLTVDGKASTFTINNAADFTVSDVGIVDESGAAATTVTSGATYYATAKFSNPSGEEAPKGATLILASYKNGRLEDIDFVPVSVSACGEVTINKDSTDPVTVTATDGTTAIRAYVWSDFANAIPYANAVGIPTAVVE